jgi:hypothetical protein
MEFLKNSLPVVRIINPLNSLSLSFSLCPRTAEWRVLNTDERGTLCRMLAQRQSERQPTLVAREPKPCSPRLADLLKAALATPDAQLVGGTVPSALQ